jgi:hypothetical protein
MQGCHTHIMTKKQNPQSIRLSKVDVNRIKQSLQKKTKKSKKSKSSSSVRSFGLMSNACSTICNPSTSKPECPFSVQRGIPLPPVRTAIVVDDAVTIGNGYFYWFPDYTASTDVGTSGKYGRNMGIVFQSSTSANPSASTYLLDPYSSAGTAPVDNKMYSIEDPAFPIIINNYLYSQYRTWAACAEVTYLGDEQTKDGEFFILPIVNASQILSDSSTTAGVQFPSIQQLSNLAQVGPYTDFRTKDNFMVCHTPCTSSENYRLVNQYQNMTNNGGLVNQIPIQIETNSTPVVTQTYTTVLEDMWQSNGFVIAWRNVSQGFRINLSKLVEVVPSQNSNFIPRPITYHHPVLHHIMELARRNPNWAVDVASMIPMLTGAGPIARRAANLATGVLPLIAGLRSLIIGGSGQPMSIYG